MAPHPDNPRLPIWHTGSASQTPGSAAAVASDERDYRVQQTSLDSMPGENGSSSQSTSHRSQPSPQLGLGTPNAGFVNYQQHYTDQPLAVPQHTGQGDDVATAATSTRVTRSRSAKQTGPPLFPSDGGVSLNRGNHSDLSYPMPLPTATSRKGQKATSKRKADTVESALESVKAPKTGKRGSARKQSLKHTTTTDMYSNTQSHASSSSKPPKLEPSKVDSPHDNPHNGNPPENEASTNSTPDCSPPGSPDGDGGGDSSEPAADMQPRSKGKPQRSLREIMATMVGEASQIGLNLYTKSMRQFYIRVGTLCSGTDAPVHVMNLFEMLKNFYGQQVFTTINSFACENEPFKQGFLTRNSKPELLFKDAKDFAEGDAETADLITGAKADIPSVDLFIAGTSCVDFSSLNSSKITDYAGLSNALKEWKTLKAKHGDKLSRQHLSVRSWRSAIGAMSKKTERKNTSTKTFAAAMNYAYWRQPKILVFENVDSAPWQDLIDCGFLQLMGYAATVHRLDTKNFHMPQTRLRKYMIAFSHQAFTLEGALALCKLFTQLLPRLQYTHSNSVTDFLHSPNSLELHRGRNEMELAAQGVRERETNWKFSKSRHTAFRRDNDIPDRRDWIRWDEHAMSNAPANMWKGWENRQPCRVSDVLECIFTLGLFGQGKAHGFYDLRFKAQIIDCSQNVDRITPNIVFGRTGCLTPNAIPVLTLEARPLTGTESLRLQGLPVENFDMSVETQAQLQDLAGNAMTTTVVGAVILAALSAVASLDRAEGFNWLENIFEKGDFEPKGKMQNSFHSGGANITHGPQALLLIKVYAYTVPRTKINPMQYNSFEAQNTPQGSVRDILALGQQARRRCVCQHSLPYSSTELHVCAVCGVSICKSCKGNPEHALVRSPKSLEDLRSLPYAQAEYDFRKCFPPVLWMRSDTQAIVQKLGQALLASTYSEVQRGELAKAIVEGLCNSTYQLQFVEINDAVRLEYTADSTFILRVVVEKEEIFWYLHLDQFSRAGEKLSDVLTTGQPIARAVLGPEERDQFPGAGSWEVWISHTVSFPLVIRVRDNHGLCLEKIGDLEGVPDLAQRSIKSLQGSIWTFHPECGFAENALWVYENPDQKLFLFKDIDPIGPAEEDVFVISSVSREMGRTPDPETRPVLLRIHGVDQIHQKLKKVLVDEEPFLVEEGDHFSIQGLIGGWWEKLERHGIQVEAFPNMEYEGVSALAKGAPTSIRRPGDLSQQADYLSCDKYQSLMTTSLPLLGKEEETVKTQETLKTLDLTHQLDLAELIRLIGPLYSAVEMGLVGTGHRVTVIQSNVTFSSDCAPCAPRIPEVFYVKPSKDKDGISRASGPVVALHRAADQQNYERNLQAKPAILRIDHNVTAAFNGWQMKKDRVPYVDIRIVAHGHALLQQARAHLPQHPTQYHDSMVTTGSFAMEVGVIENPRVVLHPAKISAPDPVAVGNARHPSGFQHGLTLFKEQSASLEWMLHRESLNELEAFNETEIAEVYLEKLHLRVHADAHRPVYRRGRVVADNVGFGKTAVCLGLIDVQHGTDRGQFLDMREKNKPLDGLVHLHATLVIVPNQLTQQWVNEAKRFLSPQQYNVVMIPTFAALQKQSVADLRKADIIICSNKVFQENKYHAELSRYCSTHGLDKIRTMQKVYRAWYKQFHKIFEQVRKDVMEIVEQDDETLAQQQRASLRRKLDQIRTDQQKLDGGEELSFAPPDLKPKQSDGKAVTKAVHKANIDWPLKLFEMFSYARIIWDEFPYENIPVTEFVADSATTSKWMLSGTPPMDTLGDICKVAYLFNVHVARPLQLVKGRQPPVCENEPLAPHSDLESTSLFQSRHSPRVLVERHEQSLAFVRVFMRKNDRPTEVSKIEKPIVLTMSTISFMSYAELQLELRSRQYNANNVGAESRRRLMSRVAWKGKGNGRERSIEALGIRGSASPEDVLRQYLLTKCSDKKAAEALLNITEKEIRGMEDRGRELLAKAFFLAQRLAFITISNTKDEIDGQEDRQLNYYHTLTDIVQSVLQVDIDLYQSWDAFESAMRMLIWDEGMRNALSRFRNLPQDDLRGVLQTVFDGMMFCKPPVKQPKWPQEDLLKKEKVRKNLAAKKKFLATFRDWLTKTPLHSRRWFLLDEIPDLDEAEEELLRLEWSEKVPWETDYDASAKNHSHMVVPISDLRDPSGPLNPDSFDLDHLRALDRSRRTRLSKMNSLSPEETAAIEKLPGYKDTKVFLEEECNRRGLVAKSTDKKQDLMARVAADMANIATDKDYVSPESCGVSLTDFPQQGKKRIRGGNMEVIFDGLMQTVDNLTSVIERSIIAHARRNLQQAVHNTLHGHRVCHDPQCDKTPAAHYVSLLCGHVFCEKPDDGQLCGVGLCQRRVKDVCIPLSKITKKERVIAASSLSGAITQDPDPYLDSAATYQKSTKGPKARAVINLIKHIKPSDAVVVFVQNAAIEKDIYNELDAADITHVTSLMLARNEAANLEKFKKGDFKVLVQTINSEQAAGSNLHNANHIIFVSPLVSQKQGDWDAHMKQALGRCVRYRQKKTVYVYHMLMDETVEVDTLEWRMKREIIVTDGQAVARFNDCEAKDFLARYEDDETATELQLAPDEGRACSILPRDDIQSLMGDDYLSLASIKALRTIDESMADKNKTEVPDEEAVNGEAEYLLQPAVDYDEEDLGFVVDDDEEDFYESMDTA